jgi:single-strand DNA-binding protein
MTPLQDRRSPPPLRVWRLLFAKTLTKGAHIQVEGELRSREYDSKKTDTKKRVWEIRVASILKLDRAEKAAPEDQDHDEVPQEETAA